MTNGDPLGLLNGGACVYRLPADATSAAMARSLLGGVMTALRLGEELIEAGVLAVSELSTNAYRHAPHPGRTESARCEPDRSERFTLPELWAWVRTEPVPQLVVSVFDAGRDTVPRRGTGAPLDENGRGLAIVEAVASDWGSYLTRSRLAAVPVRGKVTWFTLPLPVRWHAIGRVIAPAVAASRLLAELARRGIDGTRAGDDKGISLIRLPQLRGLNVWVEHKAFAWHGSGPRCYVRHPLLDLQDAAEHLVHTLERADAVVSTDEAAAILPGGSSPSSRTGRRPNG